MITDTHLNSPSLVQVKGGWFAQGKGWAVQAPTKEEAIEKYREREKFCKELLKRQPVYITKH